MEEISILQEIEMLLQKRERQHREAREMVQHLSDLRNDHVNKLTEMRAALDRIRMRGYHDGLSGRENFKSIQNIAAEAIGMRVCLCGVNFYPHNGEYTRCPSCFQEQVNAGERATVPE